LPRKSLDEKAASAARLREHRTNPDVVALHVERVRRVCDVLVWTGIVGGLAFTMVNVQAFAARGLDKDSPGWWAAWVLDPIVSLVLIGLLLGEQVLGRWQVSTRATHGLLNWIKLTKWGTFAATYTMNTWESWHRLIDDGHGASGVVLHSVPPLLVLFAAEAGPKMRDRLTEAVEAAAAAAGHARPKVAPRRPAAVQPPATPTTPKLAIAVDRLRRFVRACNAGAWALTINAGLATVGLAGPTSGLTGPGRARADEQAGPEADEQAGPGRAGPEADEQAGPGRAGPETDEQAGPGRAGPETEAERTQPFKPVEQPTPAKLTADDLPDELLTAAVEWARQQLAERGTWTRGDLLDAMRAQNRSVQHTMRTPLVEAVRDRLAPVGATE
jgi:hypothetical protein